MNSISLFPADSGMTDGKMRRIIVNELEKPCGLTLGLVKLMCWFTSQGYLFN